MNATAHGAGSSGSGFMGYIGAHGEQLKQGALVLAVGGALLGALAWTKPTTVMSTVSADVARSMSFAYRATIPSTPAYQGTQITSPDPVFRKLANVVDVTYTYDGTPATITPEVDLSTSGGWRWTVPMGSAVEAPDGTYSGTIALDLNALEAQAKAGTEAAGLPMTDLTVTVAPSVKLAEGAFNPELPLRLTKDTLQPESSDERFEVTDQSTVQKSVAKPNSIKVLKFSIGIWPLRILSLLAFLVGVAGLLLLRRYAPAGRATPAARHGDIIVPVAAVSAPVGVVIDVDDIDELVKIAKRYALLVLHWTDPTVDVYFVQDERTMYRCVVPKQGAGARGGAAATPMPPPVSQAPMPPPAPPNQPRA